MNERVAALLAEFEDNARKSQQAEILLRKKMAEEIARLERRRAFAFRRSNFMRMLALSAVDLETEDEATDAQERALREELGWHGQSEAHKDILMQMKALGMAVWHCVCDTKPETKLDVSVSNELERFEVWFESKHGKPFYALFDQYVPEAPLVDF